VFVFVFLSIRFDLVYIEARSNTPKSYKESNPYSKPFYNYLPNSIDVSQTITDNGYTFIHQGN